MANPAPLADIPFWEDAPKTRLPTIKHIPKAACAKCCQTLAHMILEVNTNYNNLQSFLKFILLPQCILGVGKGEQGAMRSLCSPKGQGGLAQGEEWPNWEAVGRGYRQQGGMGRGRRRQQPQVDPTLQEHRRAQTLTLFQVPPQLFREPLERGPSVVSTGEVFQAVKQFEPGTTPGPLG